MPELQGLLEELSLLNDATIGKILNVSCGSATIENGRSSCRIDAYFALGKQRSPNRDYCHKRSFWFALHVHRSDAETRDTHMS